MAMNYPDGADVLHPHFSLSARRTDDRNAGATGNFTTLDWPASAGDRHAKTAAMENPRRNLPEFPLSDLIPVVSFSGIGLAAAVVAIICGKPGSWS
jgi:hypothetical protein